MRAALIVVVLILCAGCATAPGALTGTVTDIAKFTRADVQRGLEIAIASNDAAGMACAGALLKILPDGASATLMPSGAFSLFMTGREVRRKVSAGVDEGVHNACAPLILDTETTLAKLGLIAVPGGGVLGGLLPR